MNPADGVKVRMVLTEVEVNQLAQLFHENADGLTHGGVHDKPRVVKGLRAVFGQIGVQVEVGVGL